MQTLREAKTMAESREQEEEEFVESRKSNFGAQFDDFQGTLYSFIGRLVGTVALEVNPKWTGDVPVYDS